MKYDFEPLETETSQAQDPSRYVLKVIKLAKGITASNFYASQIHYFLTYFAFLCSQVLQYRYLAVYRNFRYDPRDIYWWDSLIAVIVTTIGSLLYGYCSDKFGRRAMIIFGTCSLCLSFLIPIFIIDLYTGFILPRILAYNGFTALLVIPFVADYVHENSRGKGTALSTLLSAGGFLTYPWLDAFFGTRTDLNSCFFVTAILLFLILVVNSFSIKEGKYFKVPNSNPDLNPSGLFGGLREFKDNTWLIIALLLMLVGGSYSILIDAFLKNHIDSLFIDAKDPQALYLQTINFYILKLSSLLSPLVYGYLMDTENKVIQCISFVLGANVLIFVLTFPIEKPHHWILFMVALTLGATKHGVILIASFLGNKYFPTDKRGIMNGILFFVMNASSRLWNFGLVNMPESTDEKNKYFIVYNAVAAILLAVILQIHYEKLRNK